LSPSKKFIGNHLEANTLLIAGFHISEEAEGLAQELKLKFYRVSVKEYFNVAEGILGHAYLNSITMILTFSNVVFQHLAKMYFKRQKSKAKEAAGNATNPQTISMSSVQLVFFYEAMLTLLLLEKTLGILPYTKSNNYTANIKDPLNTNSSETTLNTESMEKSDYNGLDVMGMRGKQREVKKGDGCKVQ
jgi:hypothetical protein